MMKEPWNIKKDDTRQADGLPTFIIFCEDEVSEPIYFKYFETPLIKVNPIGGQKSKFENVSKTITYCIDMDFMGRTDAGLPILKKEDMHVWCVFDRDKEETDDKRNLGNTLFDESLETASARGIKVAWSNDSFELWILLHFEDINPEDKNYNTRSTYYERLTNIFKFAKAPNKDLVKALKYAKFSYKESLKGENNFRNIVRSTIISNTRNAVDRAKKLENYHFTSMKPNHERCPCTMVHHLVEELINLGGKKI